MSIMSHHRTFLNFQHAKYGMPGKVVMLVSLCLYLSSHYDLNELWTKNRQFAVDVFVMVVETMPKSDRYKAMQALVNHLDAIKDSSYAVKQGILDTLSHCVATTADGSLGELLTPGTCTQGGNYSTYFLCVCVGLCFSGSISSLYNMFNMVVSFCKIFIRSGSLLQLLLKVPAFFHLFSVPYDSHL